MFERGFLMGLADLGEEVADLENELFDELPPTYLEEDLFGYDDFDDEFGAEYSRMDMLGFDDDEFEDLFFDDDDEEYGRKYRQRRIRKLKEDKRSKKLKRKLASGRWRGRKLSKKRERKLREKIKSREKRVKGKIGRKEKREFKQKRRDKWRTAAAKEAGYKKRWHARVPGQILFNPKKSLTYHKEAWLGQEVGGVPAQEGAAPGGHPADAGCG
jgi:hypothetical protein